MWNKIFLLAFLFASVYVPVRAQGVPSVLVQADSALFFKEFRLFNEPIPAGLKRNGRVVLPVSLTRLRSVSLKHDENVFSFIFAGPSHRNKKKIRYQYKMEGFDKGWTFFDDDSQKVSYTNLDPGKYTLSIRAADNSSLEATMISMGVLIMPPYWHTPLAWLIYSVGILSLLLIFREWNIGKLKARFDAGKEQARALMKSEQIMLKHTFLTTICHEIKHPLSQIIFPLEKLLNNLPPQESSTELNLVRRNAKQLMEHVNQLMDFRKMESDELHLNKTVGNLVAYIEGITLSFKEHKENDRICLNFDSEISEFYTFFDHAKIERIMLNLLSNAYKFTPGNGRITVLLSLKQERAMGNAQLEIHVIDTGIGISADTLRNIFIPFFQNEMPAVSQGSGIGLPLLRAYVKIQQGTISVKSEPGTGTCFCISLPFKQIPGPVHLEAEKMILEILPGYQGVKLARSTEALKPLVLIVESNDDLRPYMKANLEHELTVLEASDGKEGWQKALAYDPCLIILNLQLCGTSGTALYLKLKDDPRTSHLKVLLLAALPEEAARLEAPGASNILSMPFNLQLLRSRIRYLLVQDDGIKENLRGNPHMYVCGDTQVTADNLFLQKVFLLAEENLSNTEFSIEEFSIQMCMSRHTLHKKLLELTGKTPVEFLRSMRMRKAASLLQSGELTLLQICQEVGFKNQKYFSKSFKSAFNMLPMTFVDSTLVP